MLVRIDTMGSTQGVKVSARPAANSNSSDSHREESLAGAVLSAAEPVLPEALVSAADGRSSSRIFGGQHNPASVLLWYSMRNWLAGALPGATAISTLRLL